MSALSLAAGTGTSLHIRRLKTATITGSAAAVLALAGFGLAHALIITPIWSQLLRGLPFALVGGFGLAWAFDAFADTRGLPHQRTSTTDRAKAGARFGAVMFLALAPGTALDTTLRLTGLRRADARETVLVMIAAAASGALAGWLLTRRRDGVLAFAAGAVGLLIASAGPLPVAQSVPGLWLSVAIASICMAVGVAIAFARHVFRMDSP